MSKTSETIDDTLLMMKFESIGDNCEFGIVQRCCAAEPLGLFRFSGSRIENLTDIITSDLEQLYIENDAHVFVDENNQYTFCSKRYQDFYHHSYVDADKMCLDDIKTKESERILYLIRRFREDLKSGEKIFVRRGPESLKNIRLLYRALGRHGRNWVLWVTAAEDGRPAGTVEVLDDGLLRGYVDRFKDFESYHPIDLVNWISICRQAYARRRASENSVTSFTPNKPLANGSRWKFESACDVASQRSLRSRLHRRAMQLTLSRDTRPDEVVAIPVCECPVEPRTLVVFSTWVWVAPEFNGYWVELSFSNLSVLTSQMADLSKRATWQRIWVSARVPRDVRTAAPVVRCGASKGSIFSISSWALEQGAIPAPAPPSTDRRGSPQAALKTRAFAHRLVARLASLLEPKDASHQIAKFKRGGALWRTFVDTGEMLIAAGRVLDADDVLEQAMGAFPDDPDFPKIYAMSAHVSARYTTAIVRWQRAVAIAPDDPLCHGALAANFREHGLLDAADLTIAHAIVRFPANVAILSEAARIAHARADYDQALVHWDAALALAPPHPDWLRGRVDALAAIEGKT